DYTLVNRPGSSTLKRRNVIQLHRPAAGANHRLGDPAAFCATAPGGPRGEAHPKLTPAERAAFGERHLYRCFWSILNSGHASSITQKNLQTSHNGPTAE